LNISELVIVIVGDKQAGKTSVFNRLAFKRYDDDYQPTEKEVILERDINIDKEPQIVRLIDTPGFHLGEQFALDNIAMSHVVICVYDCAGNSYNNIEIKKILINAKNL
jgi:small GTP-binding protein